MKTTAKKLIAQRAHQIRQITGIDKNGFQVCHLVLVDKAKEGLFLEAVKSGHGELKNYGTILGSCFGSVPSMELIAKMKEEYGVDLKSEYPYDD